MYYKPLQRAVRKVYNPYIGIAFHKTGIVMESNLANLLSRDVAP